MRQFRDGLARVKLQRVEQLTVGASSGERFMDALQLVTRAVSLGDAETLAQHPASMTHSTYTPQERAAHGISDGLVRLSVGLKNIDDVLADISQALNLVQRLADLGQGAALAVGSEATA